ncbi:unnamed protein product, partial [Iphiclides podalirius]
MMGGGGGGGGAETGRGAACASNKGRLGRITSSPRILSRRKVAYIRSRSATEKHRLRTTFAGLRPFLSDPLRLWRYVEIHRAIAASFATDVPKTVDELRLSLFLKLTSHMDIVMSDPKCTHSSSKASDTSYGQPVQLRPDVNCEKNTAR